MPSPVTPSQIKETILSVAGSLCLKLWNILNLPQRFYNWYSYVYKEQFGGADPNNYFTDAFIADLAATYANCPCQTGEDCAWLLNCCELVPFADYAMIRMCGEFVIGDAFTIYDPDNNPVKEGAITNPVSSCNDIGGIGLGSLFVTTIPGPIKAYYMVEVRRPGCDPRKIQTVGYGGCNNTGSSSSSYTPPAANCGTIGIVDSWSLKTLTLTISGMTANMHWRLIDQYSHIYASGTSDGGTRNYTLGYPPCSEEGVWSPTDRYLSLQMQNSSGVWQNCYNYAFTRYGIMKPQMRALCTMSPATCEVIGIDVENPVFHVLRRRYSLESKSNPVGGRNLECTGATNLIYRIQECDSDGRNKRTSNITLASASMPQMIDYYQSSAQSGEASITSAERISGGGCEINWSAGSG